MFKAKLFKEDQLLLIQHYGEFVGSENNDATLEVISGFSREEKEIEQFKFVVFDMSRVTTMSLKDSDSANTAFFERNLGSLIREKGSTPKIILGKIRIIYILSEDLGCRKIYLQRMKRIIRARALVYNYDFAESTADALRETGLESLPDLLS